MRIRSTFVPQESCSRLAVRPLGYDPKVESLMRALKLDGYSQSAQEFNILEAQHNITEMMANQDAGRPSSACIDQYRANALDTAKKALAFLTEK